ncbi:MAG: DMT family transporter [Candidatus Cloacimonetes bacterium]|nr:DMT family transporter [Candidatus Cloacimonadota bacterium]
MASSLLLLLTAALWGFAFVAQRQGMQSLDAFSFNALRFALGALFVRGIFFRNFQVIRPYPWKLGVVLFVAASLQQFGIIYTTAGNAGFITGLYVLFVPLLGHLKGQKNGRVLWLAIVLALCGMYLMNLNSDLRMNLGNLLVLISSLFWALHVQLVDSYSKLYPASSLAVAQFSLCGLLSAFGALLWLAFEPPISFSRYWNGVSDALVPLLYGGLISVGVAYTLQVYAQRRAHPAQAAVIMCLEGVFALIGGYLILNERLGLRSLIGAGLLFSATLILSIPKKTIDRKEPFNFGVRT